MKQEWKAEEKSRKIALFGIIVTNESSERVRLKYTKSEKKN